MGTPAGATTSQVIEQALGALPASAREELRARLTGAESLVVMHIRDERFRWMSLLTFPFKLLLWLAAESIHPVATASTGS